VSSGAALKASAGSVPFIGLFPCSCRRRAVARLLPISRQGQQSALFRQPKIAASSGKQLQMRCTGDNRTSHSLPYLNCTLRNGSRNAEQFGSAYLSESHGATQQKKTCASRDLNAQEFESTQTSDREHPRKEVHHVGRALRLLLGLEAGFPRVCTTVKSALHSGG
jgi:hypothetical protein